MPARPQDSVSSDTELAELALGTALEIAPGVPAHPSQSAGAGFQKKMAGREEREDTATLTGVGQHIGRSSKPD